MSWIFAALALVWVFSIYFDRAKKRHRKARLDGILVAPLPQLPLSFHWNWWGVALFMAIPFGGSSIFTCIGIAIGIPSLALPFLLSIIPCIYYVYGYLRFALKGPSFVLDEDGVAFAGNYLPWRKVSEIVYRPNGRTPCITFRQTDGAVMGFSAWDQVFGKTSISIRFISDPDGLVGWSRRLKEASQAKERLE